MSAFRRSFTLDRALLLFTGVILCGTILYPTGRLIVSALSLWSAEALSSGAGRQATLNTFALSMISVVCAGVVGVAMAFLLAKFEFPGRRILSAVAFLPFALPPLVGTLSFWYLIGPDGFIPRGLEAWAGVKNVRIEGVWAVALIHTYSFYVFFYAMVSAALENRDVSQIEAARTLGAGRFRVFFRVTVPTLKPALLGAALLTFMSSGASFSAPFFFGAKFPVLSTQIYLERSQFRHEAEVTLTVVLAALSLLGVLLFRTRQPYATGGSKGVRRGGLPPAGRWLACGAAWACVLALVTPHIVIAGLSFADFHAWHTEVVPRIFTLENYTRLFQDPAMFRPIMNSVWMSAFAAAAVSLVGLPAAYLIARRRPGGRAINALTLIPWALPGTVIAINLIVAFNGPWAPAFAGFWLLPLAYFVRATPLFTRMAVAAIEPFDAQLIEAGRSLGASRGYCFARVALPLIAPSIIAAAAMVFATSLGEFVASILIYLPPNVPMSVKIFELWRGAGVGSAFAYSVFLMAFVTITFLTARRLSTRVL